MEEKDNMTVEVLRNNDWLHVPEGLMALQDGDMFRMFLPDGTRFMKNLTNTWVVDGTPFLNEDGVPTVWIKDISHG